MIVESVGKGMVFLFGCFDFIGISVFVFLNFVFVFVLLKLWS